jgi:hypothetical protein
MHLRERSFRLPPGRVDGIIRQRGAEKHYSAGGKTLHAATSPRWHSTVVGLLPAIAWGLVVLVLTLVLLVLGAIVLPAQAQEASTQGMLIATTQVHAAGRRAVANGGPIINNVQIYRP